MEGTADQGRGGEEFLDAAGAADHRPLQSRKLRPCESRTLNPQDSTQIISFSFRDSNDLGFSPVTQNHI